MARPALHDPLVGRVHVTQDFGVVSARYPNKAPWFGKHHGIDLIRVEDATLGAPIYAPDDGTVRAVFANTDYRGFAIEVEDAEGVWEMLHQGSLPRFGVGDRVLMGSVLGEVGDTGDSQGTHLHFGRRRTDGVYIDPLKVYGQRLCEARGVRWDLYERQIEMESGWRSLHYDATLVSAAGALGIAQIIPRFHPDAGDVWSPFTALTYSVKLMASHLAVYGGDYRRALAAYNGGPGVAARPEHTWPDETRRYVAFILTQMPPSEAEQFRTAIAALERRLDAAEDRKLGALHHVEVLVKRARQIGQARLDPAFWELVMAAEAFYHKEAA